MAHIHALKKLKPKYWSHPDDGFTIVELLIVIVVIGVLASVTIISYRGIQTKARDSQRKVDVSTIRKALDLYYIDNGSYPGGFSMCSSGCKINNAWSSTSDGSWTNLATYLVPKYISRLPQDPSASATTNPAITGGYNYDYSGPIPGGWCNGAPLYIIAYRLESEPQKYELNGNCSGAQPTDYDSSEFVLIK